MNRKCLTILSVVLALTMASTHGFAGSQGAPDVTGEMGQFSYPGPADFKNAPLLAMTGGAVTAKDVIAEDKEEEMTVEEIGELMANPFSYLWFGMIQNDTSWWNGDLLDSMNEDSKMMNTTLLQPVMSMQLTEEWKMIFRPVIPI